jgi:OFA family oxalate/formate antiporter-like MFS transporter
MLKKIKSLFYGWWIVIGSFLLLVLTGGTALYGFTAFFNPISSELMWGSAAISFAFSLRSIEGGLLQPFIGIFIERVGVRKCIFAGLTLMGLSLFLLSRMTTLTIFYVGFLLLSLGFTMAAGIPQYTAVANWFKKRRSLALGLVTTGWGASGLMTPAIAMMIRFVGWRQTMFLLCPFILVIGIPLSFIIRDRPQSYGMQPDGVLLEGNSTNSDKYQEVDLGLTLKESLKTRTFWMLFFYTLCIEFAFSTIPIQEMPHLINVGISEKLAASAMAGYALVSLVGRIVISWLGDKYSKKGLLMISAVMQSTGFFIYANISSPWMIIPFIILYGPGFGATTALLPGIQADYFGTRSFASIRGMMSLGYSIGGIIAPVFAGLFFDIYHSYRVIFEIYALLAALSIPAVMMIPYRKIRF